MSESVKDIREFVASKPEATSPAQLAAIVFTDVVGYSARMGADEAATIAAVRADFERMRALCEKQGGEVLNTMGDGMMLCFGGAVAAMTFAMEMQTEFGLRNRDQAAAKVKGLQHRIGIHIGDVYRVQDGHMAGDGVNIAARLEPRAPPGGVAISQTVYDVVKNKVQMRAERLGGQIFKNIAEPVVLWRVAAPVVDEPLVRQVLDEAPRRSSSLLSKIVWLLIIVGMIDLLWTYKDAILPGGNQDIGTVLRGWGQKISAMVAALLK